MTELLYIQLREADSVKPVEILRTGVFTDRNGKEVTITADDLDSFITNFTAGAAGQDVPIDIDHKREEAGGWIKSLQREGDKLIGVVDWNELGRQLVGGKVYRYLSATIDLANKVIKSVSLVNFPAVKGLKAVELSEGVYGMERAEVPISQFLQATLHKVFTNQVDYLSLTGMINQDEYSTLTSALNTALDGFISNIGEAGNRLIPAPEYYPMFSQPKPNKEKISMDEKEKEALRLQIQAEERAKVEAELAERQQQEAELREKVRAELEIELKAKFERRQGLVEFAQKLAADGLSAKADDVVNFLEGLTPEQQEQAKAILSAKPVKLVELGSAGEGKTQKQPLPQHARQDVISGELTVADLFKAHVIDGKPEDYDLSEFNATQKGF